MITATLPDILSGTTRQTTVLKVSIAKVTNISLNNAMTRENIIAAKTVQAASYFGDGTYSVDSYNDWVGCFASKVQ